jgi:hypothetical protein
MTMTEQQWLACQEPRAMLEHLWPGSNLRRKLRLFACALCRQGQHNLDTERGRRAVEIAELFADGNIFKREMASARSAAKGLARVVADDLAWLAATRATAWPTSMSKSRMSALLREIFGNPHQPLIAEQSWLQWNDGCVVKLAQAAYDERILPAGTLDHSRLAILADALEDAGCTNLEILSHCRQSEDHYRGCWMLDILLEKK